MVSAAAVRREVTRVALLGARVDSADNPLPPLAKQTPQSAEGTELRLPVFEQTLCAHTVREAIGRCLYYKATCEPYSV